MKKHRSSYDRIVYSTSHNIEIRRHIYKASCMLTLTAIYITHTESEDSAPIPYIAILSAHAM